MKRIYFYFAHGCPRCGSHNTWSDNLVSGCEDCGYLVRETAN